jgi:hypothetical protein
MGQTKTEFYNVPLTTGWTIGIRIPEGVGNFSLRHRVQTGYVAHLASYSMGRKCSFSEGKADGA